MAPKPLARSKAVDEHFELDLGLRLETDIPVDSLPPATETPEDLARRPHTEWERNWVAGLRNPAPDHVPSLEDTNNLWNYFRPGAVEGLRASLERLARKRRDFVELYGKDDWEYPRGEIYYFEQQMYAWITSGTMVRIVEQFGANRMENLLDDMALLEVLWKDATVRHPGADTLLGSVRLEAAVLLNRLALTMYDLGVPETAIFG